MKAEEGFGDLIGLTVEGFGSDGDNHFFIELSDGSEVEFFINENNDLDIIFYAGYLDS